MNKRQVTTNTFPLSLSLLSAAASSRASRSVARFRSLSNGLRSWDEGLWNCEFLRRRAHWQRRSPDLLVLSQRSWLEHKRHRSARSPSGKRRSVFLRAVLRMVLTLDWNRLSWSVLPDVASEPVVLWQHKHSKKLFSVMCPQKIKRCDVMICGRNATQECVSRTTFYAV